MTLTGHIKFWFIVGIALFFAMSLLSTPENYYKAAQNDVENAYLAYGQEGGKEIIENANYAFNAIFAETFAKRTVDTMHNTPHKDAAIFGVEQKAAGQSNKVLKTFKMEVYALFLRVSIASRWIPVLVVLGAAAFIDGLVARKIKITGYGFTSPGIQVRMAHITVLITGMSVVATYLPINLPILWWPFATFMAVLCIRYVASNMKQITT